MSRRTAASIFCACAVVVANCSAAYAQAAPSPDQILLNDHVASLRQIQNSHVRLVTAFEANTTTGCATFVNESSQTITRVVIAFTAIFFNSSSGDYGHATIPVIVAPGAQGNGCGPKAREFAYSYPAHGSVATPIEVDYSDGTTWNAGPDVLGLSDNHANSDIEIKRTFAWQPLGECIDFVTRGTKAISHVQFTFEHVAASGAHIRNDSLGIQGSYKPGDIRIMNCRKLAGTIVPLGSAPGSRRTGIEINGGPTSLVGSVARIDYTDGTSWRIPAETIAVAAPGVPKIVYDSWWSSTPGFMQIPIDVNSESTIDLQEAVMWPFFQNDECVEYVTNSPVPTKHIRFVFVRTGVDGSSIGTDVLDTSDRRGFSTGSRHNVCYATPANPIMNNTQDPAGVVILYPSEWAGGSQ